MSQQLDFEAEPFSFEFDSESDYEFETRRAAVFAPAGGADVPLTAKDFIDSRIDVNAQYALLRMAKAGLDAYDDAGQMLLAIRAGMLGGIYKEDQRVPAMRAKEMGLGWWQLIPKGLDAAVVPASAPLIVFRNNVAANAVRLVPALRAAWGFLRVALDEKCQACTCEDLGAQAEARALRRRPSVTRRRPSPVRAELETVPMTPDPCVCTAAVPSLQSCPSSAGIERAICTFRVSVANQRLVCDGQSYWSRLAEETLKKFGPEKVSVAKESGLHDELNAYYLANREPKTPDELQAWFRKIKRRGITAEDVAALRDRAESACFDTVGFVSRLARRPITGANCLGSLDPATLVTRKPGETPCLVYKPGLASVVERMRKTLDNGFLIRAGVTWPDDCVAAAGHSVLIIGHDGGNNFVHWNTVQNEDTGLGSCFGIIKHENNELRMKRKFTAEHPVVSLQPMPERKFERTC